MTTSNALFHYTSAAGWDEIRESGFIDTTSRAADHIDGQVELVWLTDDVPGTTGLSDPDRAAVRISVDPVPSVLYWPLWRELCGNREAVEASGGEARAWYLSHRPIATEHWGQVIRTDTREVLLNPDAAPAPLSSWATMPTEKRIAEAAGRLDRLRPQDPFRAACVDRQISNLREMVDRGDGQQRQRAAWRTLKAEIAAFPTWH